MKNQLVYFVFYILLIILNPPICLSQDEEIESILEEDAEYSDQSELIELLSEFKKNPIHINTANADQLFLLPWLTPSIAQNIVNYRIRHHPFKSIEELMQVPGISPEIFNAIKDYLMIDEIPAVKVLGITQRSRIGRKVEKSEGFKNGNYFNSPNKYYNQLKFSLYQKYDMGLLFEKDSGEKHLNDLSVYYFKYQDSSQRNKLIIGNYHLEVGQGLLFGNPYGNRKGVNPIYPAISRERGIVPYSMVDENASLFGVTSQLCLKIYQFLLFYSRSQLDASLNPGGTVKNFYDAGYHRTLSEINKKDVLGETLIGGRFVVGPAQNFKVGCTFYNSIYDKKLVNSDLVRNRFDFQGDKNYVLSSDLNIAFEKMFVFGEFAQSQNQAWGALIGTSFASEIFDILFLYRNYSKNFHSLHGSAFSERGGAPQNEQGFYTGVQYKILPKTNLLIYYDIFSYPWRTYLEDMPTAGSDLFFQLEQKISRAFILTFQLKNKQREKNTFDTDQFQRSISIFQTEKRSNFRFQLEYLPISNLKLRARIEMCNFRFRRQSNGLLLYQDIKYSIKKQTDFYCRLTFFDTDDYDSRLYQFENDLPYVLTNQMLYGKGNRLYIVVLHKYRSIFRLAFKYSITNYENINTIGSGNDLIAGNSFQAVSFQLEVIF